MSTNKCHTIYDTTIYCRPLIDDLTKSMIDAAKKQGIIINDRSISISMDQEGRVAANAAVAGIEHIDMVDYERGVLSNFMFVSFAVGRLQPGFYGVTLVVPAVRIGRVEGRVHIGQGSEVSAIVPAAVNVKTLQVPLEPRTPVRTGIRFGSSFPPAEASEPELKIDTSEIHGTAPTLTAQMGVNGARVNHIEIERHTFTEPNNAINSDAKKLRCAPLFDTGYGWRYHMLSVEGHSIILGE